MTDRLHAAVTDFAGARERLVHRAVQLLADGLRLETIERHEWGARARFRTASGEPQQSLCVHVGRDAVVADPLPEAVPGERVRWPEYRAIETFYGSQRAKRSGVFLMNHVDEGLAVLTQLGASERARRAFCLHPLLQGDADLARTYGGELPTGDPRVLLLAMEYRNVANAYLSHRVVTNETEIGLGPLAEVHDMLRADKVQNYKDFLLFHREHPRRQELDDYFQRWLRKLAVSPEVFARFFEELQVAPDQRVLFSSIAR